MPPSAAFLAPTTLLALLYVVLGLRVVALRVHLRVGVGEGRPGDALHRPLRRAVRVHANFAEWVPFTLLALLVADLRGADPVVVSGLGAILCVARITHAVALSRSSRGGIARTSGLALTVTALLGAIGAAWLA